MSPTTAAGVLAAAMLLAACGGADPPDTDPPDSGINGTGTAATGTAATAPSGDTAATGTAATAPSGDTGTTGETTEADEASAERYPDVVDATARLDGDGTWTVSATLSSPYDSPERYADAWRVLGPDGTVFGVRELLHDHANEQPFTRSLSGVDIPDAVDEVTIEGRDQRSGWGGATFMLPLPR
ncbi:MAG: hypothetical protein ACFCVK_26390 [Acidimicrobiales bacterium]